MCCGCARYSFHLQLAGAKIMPIDKATNPHDTHVPVVSMDLASPADQALLMSKARAHEFDYVHAAPPCGTSTRARDKRVPLWLQRLGAPDPKPLRSTLEPEGVQGLTPYNRMKVELANSIYKFLAAFFMLCSSLGILWSCENPLRSYLWELLCWKQLIALPSTMFVDCACCMWGGTRPKISRWSQMQLA